MERLRILFLAADPGSMGQVNAGREAREIRERLRTAEHRDAIELIERFAVRPGDLQRTFFEVRPHVVHFSGHGTAGEELVLEGEDGGAEPLGKKALTELFRVHRDTIRVVVLSACHSRPQVEAIAEHVECAIGMRRAVGSRAATEFSAAFYLAVGFGASVAMAFESAVAELRAQDIPEDSTPQLVVRPGTDAKRVILLGPREGDLPAPAPVPAPPSLPRPPSGRFVRHAHGLPRARHFVGRDAALALLRAWFAGEGARDAVVAVVALGGAGKTSVVERFLSDIGDGPHPGGVFVWSFYDDPRVEAFLDQALAYFAPGRAAQPGERLPALEDALRGGGHLLVLDGLEIVQGTGADGGTFGHVEDASLRRLLSSAVRGLARVLCTTRLPLTDLAAWEGAGLLTLRLEALTEAEGLALLAGWGLAGAAPDLASLCARVGGHALSIAMIGSYAGAFLGVDAARVHAIALEPAARDDVTARHLLSVLSAYARALPAEDRDILARLALFPGGARLDVLESLARAGGLVAGALAGLDREALARGLARLMRLGLVHASRGGGRFAVHPFLAEYFSSLLGVPADEYPRGRLDRHARAPRSRARAPRRAPRRRHRHDAPRRLRGAPRPHPRRRPRGGGGGHLRASMGGFGRLGLRLGGMARGLRVVGGFADGGDPARVAPALPLRTRAAVAFDLGLYAGAVGDLALALRCYRAHNALAREDGNLDALATGLRGIAYTERLTGDLASALAFANAAVDVSQGVGFVADVVRAVALGRASCTISGASTTQRRGSPRCGAWATIPSPARGLWEAEHVLALGRVEEARAAVQRVVEACDALGWEGHAAHGHTILGLAALAADPPSPEEARRCLVLARRWTAASGEVEVILRCLDLEARIALAEGAAEKAVAAIEEGKKLSGDLGFGFFAARFAALGHG